MVWNKKWQNYLFISVILAFFAVFCLVDGTTAEEKSKEEKSKKEESTFELPKNVLSIEKENTFPNVTEDSELLEASKETKELLQANKVKVENPEVIKMLNESAINPSPISIGYRATIFLGRWPLYYESENTSVTWDYQAIKDRKSTRLNSSHVAISYAVF